MRRLLFLFVVVCLLGSGLPGQSLAAQAAATVKVRVGEHADYLRIVFDWPSTPDFKIERQGKNAFIRFQQPFTASNLKIIGKELDPHVTSAYLSSDQKTVVVNLRQVYEIKHFTIDKSAVVDIMLPKEKAPPKPAPAPEKKPEPKDEPKPEAKPEAETAKLEEAAPTAPPPPDSKPAKAKTGLISGPAVPLYVNTKDGHTTLRFAWPMDVGAAVFRRGNYMWAVFSEPGRLVTNVSLKEQKGFMGPLQQVELEKGTAVRFQVAESINVVVTKQNLSWVLDIQPQANTPENPIPVEVQPNSALGPRLFLKAPFITSVYPIHDPAVGDTLFVAPVGDAGHGVAAPQELIQLRVLETAQGIAVETLADGIQVERQPEGLQITSKGLLYTDPWLRQQQPKLVSNRRLFDFEKMSAEMAGHFPSVRHRLEQNLVTNTSANADVERLKMAQLYFYNDFPQEAMGWIQYMKRENPTLATDPDVLALEGAVHVLLGDGDRGWAVLRQSQLDDYADIDLWRAGASALQDNWTLAANKFGAAVRVPADYPQFLRVKLQTLAARTAMANDDYESAKRFLSDLLSLPDGEKLHHLYPMLGDAEKGLGNKIQAREAYKKATQSGHPGSQAWGQLGLTRLQLETKEIKPEQAMEQLDDLRFAWSGDGFRFYLLRNLGELSIGAGEYRDGLKALHDALEAFPDHAETPKVQELMLSTFADLYLHGKADDMPPLKALALFDEFKELAPTGEAGDTMIAKLADRLMTMDLLGRAASLLTHQVESRLQGVEKARIGSRLALIYLLDRNPEAALKALEISAMDGLPAPLAAERRRLEARAASDLGDATKGLELLADDMSPAAENLRADLYWQLNDWPQALRSLLRLVGSPRPGNKLEPKTAQYILNAAVAAAMAGDNAALAELNQRYGPAMSETQLNQAFQVVTKDTLEVHNLSNLASQLEEIKTFESFLQTYKDKIKDKGLSGVN